VNGLGDYPADPGPTRPLACGDRALRRRLVRDHPEYFGIDFAQFESGAGPADDPATWQADPPRLRVGLLEATLPDRLSPGNFRVEGGERPSRALLRVVKVDRCEPHDPNVPAAVLLTLDRPGDFAPYVVRLVEADPRNPDEPTTTPMQGVDPVFDRAGFRFPPSPECDGGAGLDCAPPPVAPPPVPDPPGGRAVIDYLSRDYDDLRDLMLQRLQVTVPYWTERHASDLVVTLVELLAYAGDRLSYAQDAVATEAYLSTARRRVSVRRLARLIDYPMTEGCAARTFVSLQVADSTPIDLKPADKSKVLRFRTAAAPGRPRGAADDGSLVFVPVAPTQGPTTRTLDPGLNVLSFYSWGDQVCQLPAGATSATLWAGPGQFPDLSDSQKGQAAQGAPPAEPAPPPAPGPAPRPGDVFLFVEVIGPRTGNPADADPRHRHAVRLTTVRPRTDPIAGRVVWDVTWDDADRLPFTMTVSCLALQGDPQACGPVPDVTVALGNVLLVEHGGWSLPASPSKGPETLTAPPLPPPSPQCTESGAPLFTPVPAAPWRPVLANGPLTFAEPFPRPDLMALRQAHALRQFRDWLAAVPSRARQALLAGADPIAAPDRVGRLLTALIDEPTRRAAGLQLPAPDQRQPAQREAQARALAILEARPGSRYEELLRRLGAVIERLEAGRPLTAADQGQFERALGLSAGDRGDLTWLDAAGLVWDSPRWYGPASEALAPDAGRAVPALVLRETAPPAPDDGSTDWLPQPDLLSGEAGDRVFVAEIDDDGRANLRFAPPPSGASAFGDADALGLTPAPGQQFWPEYRTGLGAVGNIAADALTRVEGLGVAAVVRQPLPAGGGADPETLDHVRRVAPGAIMRLDRAITPADYATLAARHPGVKRAEAVAHRDGVGTVIVVAVDAAATDPPSAELLEQVGAMLEGYRRINHAVAVVPATYVAVRLTLNYRVAAGAQAGHVRAALLDVFSDGASSLRAGGLGYFNPTLWDFGRPVEASSVVAEAMAVAGVRDAMVSELVRLDPPGGVSALSQVNRRGVLPIGPLEIVRLENDASLPERGLLRLVLADDQPVVCKLPKKGSKSP
jgi:predicted phage baseplate assembly protein